MLRVPTVALALSLVAGCASTSSDLKRAMGHYEEARYETVLVWLAELEPELPEMDPPERAQFLYLRGMAAYRLGQLDDALHYLALAREVVALEPRSLSVTLSGTLDRALAALAPDSRASAIPGERTR